MFFARLGISFFFAKVSSKNEHFRYQKTSEVVAGTADTVKNKWNDMRNSSFFKSFESKLGSAYNNVGYLKFVLFIQLIFILNNERTINIC